MTPEPTRIAELVRTVALMIPAQPGCLCSDGDGADACRTCTEVTGDVIKALTELGYELRQVDGADHV